MKSIKHALLAVATVGLLTAASAQTTIMKLAAIQHTVADYDKWKIAFDADEPSRKASGMTVFSVLRGLEDPNLVLATCLFDDVQKAKAFTADPRLKAVMEKAGVTSAPEIHFYNVKRLNNMPVASRDRAVIRLDAKDLSVWLKVFDEEGLAARANDGMEDRLMATDMDAPNTVVLSFYVTDVEKMKAAMASDAKKKVIEKSGVLAPPVITLFQSVQ